MTNRKISIFVALVASLAAAALQLFYGFGWVASAVLLAIAGHYSSMAGWLPALLNTRWQRLAEYGLLGFFTLWFAASMIWQNNQYHLIWVACSAVLFAANVSIVANVSIAAAKPKP